MDDIQEKSPIASSSMDLDPAYDSEEDYFVAKPVYDSEEDGLVAEKKDGGREKIMEEIDFEMPPFLEKAIRIANARELDIRSVKMSVSSNLKHAQKVRTFRSFFFLLLSIFFPIQASPWEA